jgi:predicted lipoprotein with Yx(FWY)xxD motif
MRRTTPAIIGIIVIIIIGVGAFAVLHGPSNPSAKAPSSTNQQDNTPAVNNAVLTTKTDPTLGQYLADPNGMPLYTYNADSKGVSNCTGACLSNWPIYAVSGSTSNLPAGVSTIKRSDNGQTQYTYNGLPLYYFTGDSKDKVNGDGVENFSIAKPAAASSSTQPTSTTPTTTTQPSNSPSLYPY